MFKVILLHHSCTIIWGRLSKGNLLRGFESYFQTFMTIYLSCLFKNFIDKIVERAETKFLALLVKHRDLKEYGALSFNSTHSQNRPLYKRLKSYGNFRQKFGRTPGPYWTLFRGKVSLPSRHQGVWGVELSSTHSQLRLLYIRWKGNGNFRKGAWASPRIILNFVPRKNIFLIAVGPTHFLAVTKLTALSSSM
jgi:hypothetical protein